MTKPGNWRSTGRRCGLFVAIALGLWLLAAGPAYALAGESGLLGLSIAAGLCLTPGLLVFVLHGLYGGGKSQAAIVLGGTVLRLAFVAGGVMIVVGLRPDLGLREFVVWVLVYYLALLLAETLLIVRERAA